MNLPDRDQIVQAITSSASCFGMDPAPLIRQCEAESSFNQAARSRTGAIGLFQLEPPTAKDLKINAEDWKANVFGGVKYMHQLLAHFGEYDKALAAYNWGWGHMTKLLDEHPKDWRSFLPLETKKYIARILPPTPAATEAPVNA